MRMSHSKRVISVIVALSMVLTMMSGLNFSTVSAASAVSVDTWGELKTALESTGDVNITVTNEIDFTATSATEAINSCISVSSGNKTIDLGGWGIYFFVDVFEYMEVSGVPKSPITVSGNASLHIKDANGNGIISYSASKSDYISQLAPKESGGLISIKDSATVKVENAFLNNIAIGPCINVVGGSPNVILDKATLSTGAAYSGWSGGFALFISDATTKPSITFSNGAKLGCSNTDFIHTQNFSKGSGAMYVGNPNTAFTINSVSLVGTVQVRVADKNATKLPFVSVSTHQIKVNKIIHTNDADYLLGPDDFDKEFIGVDKETGENIYTEGSGLYHFVIVEKITTGGDVDNKYQGIVTEITKLSDVVEESDTFDSVVDAFSGAYGATEVDYKYDFSDNFANANLYAGTTSFKDKFTPSIGNAESSITVTSAITAQMKGFSQFYSDVRWTSASEMSFDLKMVSSGENFAGFYIKYGKEVISGNKNEVFYSNDGVRGDSANSTTGTTGIGFSFRTIDDKPCIEIFVKYLDNSGNLCVSSYHYYNSEINFKEFNNYRVVDNNNGVIKFYVNNNLFATVVCSEPKVPTASKSYTEQYYSKVLIMDQNGIEVAEVSNALVSTTSAVAFATRNETLELDNFYATDKNHEDPSVDGASLILSSDITVRYLAKKERLDNIGYTDVKAKVVLGNTSTIITPEIITVGGIECYSFKYYNVFPKQMNDKMYVTVYGKLNDKVYASDVFVYSAATYAYNKISNDTTQETLKTLLVDMLNYGAAAQIFSSYNTENLVNANLTTAQKAYGTQTLRELENHKLVPSLGESDGEDTAVETWDVEWSANSLILENNIVLRLYFSLTSNDTIIVKITDEYGNLKKTINTSDINFKEISGQNSYYFAFDDMRASELSVPFCFTAYNQYDQAVSGTYIYSVESYAYSKQNDSNVNLANLVKAMMMYGDAVANYIGTGNTENEDNGLNIIKNANANYSIVYSESASENVINAANKISDEITKTTGVTLETMYDTEAESNPNGKYIIVGETSLKDSLEAKSSLNSNAADSFVITDMANGNIVVISNYEDQIVKAAEYYVNNLLVKNYNASSSTLKYEGYNNKGTDTLPEGFKFADLSKSKIVYATNLDGYRVVAETLRNQIKSVYKIDLPIYADDEIAPSAREILIGETNRELSKSYYKNNGYIMEYNVVAQNGSLQILSGGSFTARKAVEALATSMLKTADTSKELNKGSYTSKKLLAKKSSTPTGTNARLMTINIMPYVLGEAEYAAVLPIRERAEIFAGILISYAPDAIGLQEACFKWQEQIPHYVEVINDKYNLGYDFVLSTYNGKNNYCPMLYRADKYNALECKYQHYDYHTSSANKNGTYLRGASQLVLQNKNNTAEKFIVINAHWDHGGQTTTANPQYMNECASSEAAIVNEYKLKYPNVRIFCVGDFNSHRYNEVFFKQFCSEIDGSVASEVAKESGTLITAGGYHGSGEKLIENGTRADCSPTTNDFIDHLVFTSSNSSVKTSVLNHDTLYSTEGYCHILSDHCPVYADFGFTQG